MTVKLSNRLLAIASLVDNGAIVADIGTDHGYIPIWLVEKGISPSAYAMDVNEGPIERAREHIERAGLSDRITVRLSDGLDKLENAEADTCIIAGMGGMLMIRLLEAAIDRGLLINNYILQPQSDIPLVRSFMTDNGYKITEENMVLEDGKYYFLMKCCKVQDEPLKLTQDQCEFGPYLIECRHPLLVEWMKKELSLQEKILVSLENGEMTPKTAARSEEVKNRYQMINRVLDFMGE